MKFFPTAVTLAILLCTSCTGRSVSGNVPSCDDYSWKVETIEYVVVDSTGRVLGEKANEVGDYYIISPYSEIVPKEGHSIISIIDNSTDTTE